MERKFKSELCNWTFWTGLVILFISYTASFEYLFIFTELDQQIMFFCSMFMLAFPHVFAMTGFRKHDDELTELYNHVSLLEEEIKKLRCKDAGVKSNNKQLEDKIKKIEQKLNNQH